MGILSEGVEASTVQFFCKKLVEKIEKYPEAEKALKELGREVLEILPAVSDWMRKYYQIFRQD